MLNSETQNVSLNHPLSTQQEVKEDDRRIQRIELPLPVRVEVRVDTQVSWNEITRLNDISAFGAGFHLKRHIKRGRLILLTIPMPRQLRSYDYAEPQYKVWGIVRRCISVGKSSAEPDFAIGVVFTGKSAPPGYVENPAMLFDTFHREGGDGFWHVGHADLNPDESDLPKELRKQTRFHIPEALLIEKLDAAGNTIESELSVTENISVGGAAVFTTLKADPGAFIRVTSERFNITILSIVRGSRPGDNGILRLHIEFIDHLFPLEGID
ncbi:MAG: hypothetical protein ABJB40_10830 [Acidobacteriota bacterium]